MQCTKNSIVIQSPHQRGWPGSAEFRGWSPGLAFGNSYPGYCVICAG